MTASLGLYNADARRMPFADKVFQVCITSTPYWGLRKYLGDMVQVFGGVAGCEHEWGDTITAKGTSRWDHFEKDGGTLVKSDYSESKTAEQGSFCRLCGAWRGELGLEPNPEIFVEHIVEIFREVRRVLRDDGTCWLNLGDSYNGSGGAGGDYNAGGLKEGQPKYPGRNTSSLKPKDLCGIPWRVAFALQADGWYLRSDVIWSKPNPMPESLAGWRWERHRVKVGSIPGTQYMNDTNRGSHDVISGGTGEHPNWQPCPGCAKCDPHGGLVLRRGSWRPTKSHEYLFMLAKSDQYYADADAVREAHKEPWRGKGETEIWETNTGIREGLGRSSDTLSGWGKRQYNPAGRNRRTVWQIATAPYSGAHFACVDAETECLTVSGWKYYNELVIGEQIASYNLNNESLEWMPLENIRTYPVVDLEMVRLKGRNINQLLTPDHRCLIERRQGHKVIIKAKDLKPTQKILVASEWNEASTRFSKRLAQIIGWYVTEGHAGLDCVHIYQSVSANPEYCKEIDQLLRDEGAEYKRYTRTRIYNGEQRMSSSWRIIGSVANILLAICPDRTLPKGFLNWNIESLEALWDALMKGDGHFREAGRQTFVQKNKVLIDQVQALATRLGFATTLRKRSKGTWALYKTISKKRWLRSETTDIISRDKYTGVVWCPQNRNTTFVARRNGSVFITGNTFPPALVEPCIKAATSEHGCCPECGAGWARVVELTPEYAALLKSGKAWRDNAGKPDKYTNRQPKDHPAQVPQKNVTTGWRPTCDCCQICDHYNRLHGDTPCPVPYDPVPSLVLDPFCGSGTSLLVARKLGRRGVGTDLSFPYLRDQARKRLGLDKLDAWRDGRNKVDTKLEGLPMFEEMR